MCVCVCVEGEHQDVARLPASKLVMPRTSASFPRTLALPRTRYRSKTSCAFRLVAKARITTRFYDKRCWDAFHGIRLSRFVHASSSVNEGARRDNFVRRYPRRRHLSR